MQEEAMIEREASAPLLERIIEENSIQGALFDLDGTLFETDDYYINKQLELAADICEHFESTIPTETFIDTMQDIYHKLWVERNFQPMPMYDQSLEAFDRYFKGNTPIWCKTFLERNLEDFYTTCPDYIDGAVPVLRFLKQLNIPFGLNSHAQDGWTKIKACALASELNMHAIPFNAVRVDRKKEAYSWLKSARIIGSEIQNSLVVGDSFNSDILPAIEAGCRNLVWIEGNLNKLPLDIRENPNIHIWCVDSVKDLL